MNLNELAELAQVPTLDPRWIRDKNEGWYRLNQDEESRIKKIFYISPLDYERYGRIEDETQ